MFITQIMKQYMARIIENTYQNRGIQLCEVATGFRFQVAQTIAPLITKNAEEKPQRYSRALLETLALIAYRQPITRGEIEDIRGVVVSSQIIKTLEEQEWIRVIGHKDVPGKPALFATTKNFLDHFGLKNLDELPPLAELKTFDLSDPPLENIASEEKVQVELIEALNTETELTINTEAVEEVEEEVEKEVKEEDEHEIA